MLLFERLGYTVCLWFNQLNNHPNFIKWSCQLLKKLTHQVLQFLTFLGHMEFIFSTLWCLLLQFYSEIKYAGTLHILPGFLISPPLLSLIVFKVDLLEFSISFWRGIWVHFTRWSSYPCFIPIRSQESCASYLEFLVIPNSWIYLHDLNYGKFPVSNLMWFFNLLFTTFM